MIPPDAWDVEDPTRCPVCGTESCEEHLPPSPPKPNGKTTEPPHAAPRITFRSAADVMVDPPPATIIEGVAWQGCVTALIAESGAGKTFVLSEMSAALPEGLWHGRRTQPGSVAYLSFEGDAFGLRLRALRQHYGSARGLAHLHHARLHDPLSPRLHDGIEERALGERVLAAALDDLTATLTATGRPAIVLLIVDTIRASLSGNEDSSDVAAAYLRVIRRLLAHTLPHAGALLAHHAGWQDGDTKRKRERGSSAWRGNCDATLYLEAGAYDRDTGEAALTLSALKVRDGETPAPLSLVRRRITLDGERDAHGQPVTSCVIVADDRTPEAQATAQAAAAQATLDSIDLIVLRAIDKYRDAVTNLKALRYRAGLGQRAVEEAVGRLLRAELILEGKRGQPYTLTPAGLARIEAAIR